MKVIVYYINQKDKEFLALANRKKHKITIIAGPLNNDNVRFAEEKDAAIIINPKNQLSDNLILNLISFGIKYLLFRTHNQFPVNTSIIKDKGLKYLVVTAVDSRLAASQIIDALNVWEKK
ncbi:hypothetical protein [Chryseobacterium taichungense]|uniref:hypothetical protein n=1 Tax=Chryseobacterium taichungense TaxID=295069 RepID=UPI0028B24F8F|nr:hypothetical protein [Chryseobacterium taichungense]